MAPELAFLHPVSTEIFIRQLWQLSLAMVFVGAITALFCRRQPHLAYALWLIVLIKAVTPPLWISNLSVFSSPTVSNLGNALITTTKPSAIEKQPQSYRVDDQGSPSSVAKVPEVARIDLTRWTWPEILIAVWLAGIVAMLLLSMWSVRLRWRRIKASEVIDNSELANSIKALAARLQLRSVPQVVVTRETYGPALVGVWRPTIVLPECVVQGQQLEEYEPYLIHELIHLRRGDHWSSALQAAGQIVWWFHPLVWWMNRQICQLRERCCDQESVCALGGTPNQYAKSLLAVLDAKVKLRPIYGFPGVRPVQVTRQRLEEIMTMSSTFRIVTPAWCWATALALAIAILPGMPWTDDTAALDKPTSDAESKKITTPEKIPSTQKKKNLLLKYGDNKPDGKRSIAGAGEMIRFELQTETDHVRGIRVHGSRYGREVAPKENFEITFLSGDMKEVLHTELAHYATFKRTNTPRWTRLTFKNPVEVPQKFWVVLNFNAQATKGVYVSYDTSTKGKYSRVGTTDEDARKTKVGGDWMVQVMLAK